MITFRNTSVSISCKVKKDTDILSFAAWIVAIALDVCEIGFQVPHGTGKAGKRTARHSAAG